jgi:hypothetical protein
MPRRQRGRLATSCFGDLARFLGNTARLFGDRPNTLGRDALGFASASAFSRRTSPATRSISS